MSLDLKKVDPVLGKKVHQYLIKKKVETPLLVTNKTSFEKIQYITKRFEEIMLCLGLNLGDDSLCATPERVAKMYVNETLWGLNYDNFPKIMQVENKMQYTSMVVERKITVMSLCEHHWLPIVGKAHVAYIPNDKVAGISKLNRIVEFFCRRPQVQERLSEQIFHALNYILNTDNIAINIVADHFCVKCRGVEDHNSDTVTTRLGGFFMSNMDVRNEFYEALKL